MRPIDAGAFYYFDFVATTHEQWFPLFLAGYLASSWWVAGLIIVLCGIWLASQQKFRAAFVVLATTLAALLLAEGVRLLVDRTQPPKALKWGDLQGWAFGGARESYASFPSVSLLLSTMAWVFLWFTARETGNGALCRLGIFVLGVLVVLAGGFMCSLLLSRYYLSDLLAGLVGGLGLAFVGWSFVAGAGSENWRAGRR